MPEAFDTRASEALATEVSPQALMARTSSPLCPPLLAWCRAARGFPEASLSQIHSHPHLPREGGREAAVLPQVALPPPRARPGSITLGLGLSFCPEPGRAAAAGEVWPEEPAWAESPSPTWTDRVSWARVSG